MTPKQKDEAMDEIYEAARSVAQDRLGIVISDDTADALVDAIGAYLGEPDEQDDPTPWCAGCGAMRKRDCHCGPLADND